MAVQKGDFIKLNYTGRFEDGRVFDTTDEELAKKEDIFNPRGLYGGDVIIVGAGHTIEGLDEDLEGKEAGHTGKVVIPPEKAFGLSNPKLLETVSITKLQDRNVHPGLTVELDGRKGIVSRVIGRRVTVDFNSPLAGKTVSYEYKIEEIFKEGIDKIQGLLALYTGIRDLEVEVEDKVVKIYVPTGLTFNQRWLMSKNRIATELFTYADFKEIQLIEKLTPESQAKVMTEIEEKVKEETEDETESQSGDSSESES